MVHIVYLLMSLYTIKVVVREILKESIDFMLQIKNISKQYKTGDLVQHALNDVSLNLRDNLLIGCISRDGRIITPRGSDTIEVGDSVIVVTTHSGIATLDDIFAFRK